MTDLEFLQLYHSVDNDIRTLVDLLLAEGQSQSSLQETQNDTGRVVLDPRYLYATQDNSH